MRRLPACRRPARLASLAPLAPLALALLAACGRDEVAGPVESVAGTVTVDASAGWGYLSLAAESVVAPTDPASSTAWDLAFNATNVMVNGGAAGPGGVTAFCVCQNASATNEQVLAMTAASELADFDAVGSAAIPATGFAGDELRPAIADWYAGSGAAATAASGKTWLVRLHDEARFAKLRVAALQGPTATSPGRVTLEYAVQPAADAPLGAVQTLAVDVPATGAVRVNLADGATTTSTTAWDLRLEGWTLRTNGGVSGSGKAAAYASPDAFEAITTAAVDSRAYVADRYAGIFAATPWYRYNILGDHRISPTFNVYLIRRGSDVYKVQLVDYYGPAGETRRITVRYEQIAG